MIAVGAAALVILAQALPTARVEPIRIAYHAPARCPDEAQFRAEVFARTALARSAAEGEAAREFSVDIADRADGSLAGSLEIHSADAPASRRDMEANRCDELVSALALMVALAVDPEGASLSASGPAPQSPAPPGQDAGVAVATWSTPASPQTAPPLNTPPTAVVPTAVVPTAVAPTAVAPKAAPTAAGPTVLVPHGPAHEPPAREATAAPPADAAEKPDARRGARRGAGHSQWAVGTQALVLAGLLPSVAVGGGATLDYDFVPNRVTSPGLRLALSAAGAETTFSEGVGATFVWAWAHVEGCPLRVRLAGSLRLSPCVGVDGGLLGFRNKGLRTNVDEHIQPWFAAEAAARLGWTFAGRWLAQAGLVALAPFQQAITYNKESGDTAAAVQARPPEPVGLEAELGIGGWLP